jgi:hypothetical protein
MNVQLKKLHKEHEALLLRFVGVSDPLLKEQLGDDLVNLENEIALLEVSTKETEKNETVYKSDESDTEMLPEISCDDWNEYIEPTCANEPSNPNHNNTNEPSNPNHNNTNKPTHPNANNEPHPNANNEPHPNANNEYKYTDSDWFTDEERKIHAEKTKKELRECYEKQFIKSDIITCIEKTNNINLQDIIKKLRLRNPADITQRKELCILLNSIDKNLTLLDYEGIYIDNIGKGSTELKLYCGCFTRFNESICCTVYRL